MIKAYLTIGDLPSWLALRGLKHLHAEANVEIELHPLLVSLGNVANSNKNSNQDDPLAVYKARRAKARSDASAREKARLCEMLGIETPAEYDGHYYSVALEWCREQTVATQQQLLFLERSSESIHHEQITGSIEQVIQLLTDCDIPTEGFTDFAANRLPTLLREQDAHVENGILSAPAFLVDDQLFIGREHFPLINWIVAGRKGQPPV